MAKHPTTVYANSFTVICTEHDTLIEFFYQPPYGKNEVPEEDVPLVAIALSKHTANGLLQNLQLSLSRREQQKL